MKPTKPGIQSAKSPCKMSAEVLPEVGRSCPNPSTGVLDFDDTGTSARDKTRPIVEAVGLFRPLPLHPPVPGTIIAGAILLDLKADVLAGAAVDAPLL